MATVRITYWRDIPMLVTARDAAGETSVPLSPAFQELVDRVAMLEGATEEDAYLAGWRVGPAEDVPGAAGAVAAARARELEAGLEALRDRHLSGPRRGGPPEAGCW
jgi:cvfA/B/C family virulence factor